MRDAGTQDWDDVGDDFRWLSYEEIGQACGISAASAIRLAFARKWKRRDSNDGTVRVAVPVADATTLADSTDIAADPVGREVGEIVGLLETAATMLRERGEAADGLMAALHANGEAALARAEATLARAEATVTVEREARRRAEASRADAEAALLRLRADLDRVSRDAETRLAAEQAAREQAESRLTVEQGAREQAEAEAAGLRQEEQVRQARGLVARLLAALRGA
jgi:ElaB/YqjD/DUF883 family membrane-anchored ribosome-binding protein